MRASIDSLTACVLAAGAMLGATGARADCGPYVVDPNTAALWHFEEGQGDLAIDSAHFAFAHLEGAEYSDLAVPFGDNHHSVDVGFGRYLRVSGNPFLNPRSQITVEAWIRPRSFPNVSSSGIIRKNDAFAAENYSLEIEDGDRIRFSLNAGGSIQIALGFVTFQLNQWAHVAGTYDGSSVKVWVNGQVVATTANVSGQIAFDNSPFYVGRTSIENYFDGQIDEVRISNRARTADEFHLDLVRLEALSDRFIAHTGTLVHANLRLATPCGGEFALETAQVSPAGNVRVLEVRPHFVTPDGFEERRVYREHLFDGTEPPGTYRLRVRLFDGTSGALIYEKTASVMFTP